jgi:hypothetical protein
MLIETVFFTYGLTCARPKIDNHTDEWNKIDDDTYRNVSVRCQVHFPEAPCMKKFIKTEENIYHVVCGEKGTP